MSEVLVLVDHSEGAVTAFTGELLAAAARLGTPAAVVVGKPGTAEALAAELGEAGRGHRVRGRIRSRPPISC